MSSAANRLLLFVAFCCVGVSQVQAGEAEDQFAAAADQYVAKHWDQAAEKFHQFAIDNPNHPKHAQAMLFAGESLVQQGRNAEAYPLLVDLLAEQPTGPIAKQALFRAAEAAVNCGKTDEAQIRLSQFQSTYPNDKLNANILIDRANLALHAGDAAAAEKFYRQSIERFGDLPIADQSRLGLVHTLELQNQPEAADQLLREVAASDRSPYAETALLQLATKQLSANQPQAALDLYAAIEKRFPTSPMLVQTHVGCGQALFQLGHFAEAENVLTPLADNTQVSADARHWLMLTQQAAAEEKKRVALEQQQQRLAQEQEQRRLAEEQRRKVQEEQERKAAQLEQDRKVKEEERRKAAVAAAKKPEAQSAPGDTTGDPTIVGALKSVLSARRDPKAAVASPTVTAVDDSRAKRPVVELGKPVVEPAPPVADVAVEADADKDKSILSPEEQDRRRSATIRYQSADALIRSGDYARAIATLQMGDSAGDDPRSLGNRYLLAVAMQKVGRDDEALQTLDQLSAALQARLAGGGQIADRSKGGSGDASSLAAANLSRQDAAALRTLNDKVQLARAAALVTREKFSEAIEPLQNYLATSSHDAGAEQALSTLAVCLAKTNRIDDASRVVAELKSNFPNSTLLASTTREVAQAAYDAGKFAAAAELFSILANDTSSPDSVAAGLAGVAWCRYQTGEFEAANTAMALFLQRFPTDPHAAETALMRGRVLERLKKDDEAAVVYRQALKRYPEAKQMPQMILAAARLYDRLGQDDEAVPLYQRIVREYPKSPDVDAVLYDLSWSLRDLGRGNDSDKVFRKLCDEHPKSRFAADATYRLAERASQQGDRETARTMLVPLLANADCPSDVRQHALYLLGQMAISEEKWAAAEPFLAQLVHDFPDGQLRLPGEFWLAEVAFRGSDYVTAQQRFETLAPKVADHSQPWMAVVPLRRAQILAGQKQWPTARAMAETIAQDYPQFDRQFEADFVIGRSFMAEDKLDEARAAFLRVVRSTTGGKTEIAAMSQTKIGDTYFQQENYAVALREYLKVDNAYAFPHWQASALLQAAKCYEQLGQPKEAGEMYARMLQSFPQTEFVAEASRKLMETTRK